MLSSDVEARCVVAILTSSILSGLVLAPGDHLTFFIHTFYLPAFMLMGKLGRSSA